MKIVPSKKRTKKFWKDFQEKVGKFFIKYNLAKMDGYPFFLRNNQ